MMRKAGQQVRRKVAAVQQALLDQSALAQQLGVGGGEGRVSHLAKQPTPDQSLVVVSAPGDQKWEMGDLSPMSHGSQAVKRHAICCNSGSNLRKLRLRYPPFSRLNPSSRCARTASTNTVSMAAI